MNLRLIPWKSVVDFNASEVEVTRACGGVVKALVSWWEKLKPAHFDLSVKQPQPEPSLPAPELPPPPPPPPKSTGDTRVAVVLAPQVAICQSLVHFLGTSDLFKGLKISAILGRTVRYSS